MSAKHAIGFRADLDVRLLNQRVLLKPSNNEYQPNMAYSQEQLPLLWGTHIAFSFKLIDRARIDQRAAKVSMAGVERLDASFASEAIVDLAAERIGVPITVWDGTEVAVIGLKPSAGNREALEYALSRAEVRTAAFADVARISIANASTKFKQLWEQGFMMRTEGAADSGGIEFLYRRIG